MIAKLLSPRLSVSSQLSLADISDAKAQGFRAIIVNRPDGEEPGQPTIAEIKDAALASGMAFAAIPVHPGKATVEDASRFADALQTLDGPVVAYCRTGVRAATLRALSVGAALDPDATLKHVAAAGYDLSALRPKLTALYKSEVDGCQTDSQH